jgi:murein DD-endopeptidase MepM/ murein hydrolase activator NlpD
MDMQKDLRKGDRLRVLFQPEGDEEVHIAALTYDSDKHKTRYRAYYLTPQGEQWGSFFDPDGREIPARLTDKVLADYEQITALLGDGRDHKGVDFMTPLGTAVYSPKDATVLRTTWNFKYNGNSLELRFGDGTIARYLHLQKVADGLAPGGKVKAGQQIAASGNTGRTNAPHLHYELEQGGRVVDPFEYHASTHRQLEGAELERLHEVIELYERAMDTAPATAGDGDEATAVPDDQSAPTT